jgi:sterol 3beta-glucosyltransferase
MRVLLASVGSRGDIEPFVALGAALQRAGHEALLCASPRFRAFAAAQGVALADMDDGFLALLDTLEGRSVLERSAGFVGQLRTMWQLKARVAPLQLQMQRDVARAAAEFKPDLLVAHLKLVGAPDIAAARGIRSALLMLVPALAPTSAFGNPVLPRLFDVPGLRRTGYALVDRLASRFGAGPVQAWRRECGLPPRPPGTGLRRAADGRDILLLHAHSPALVPQPADWPAQALVTGSLDLPAPDCRLDWQPDAALATFLQAGPAPVYVGFGSMAGRNPGRVAGVVVDALQAVGQRGLLAPGWGGLAPGALPPGMHLLGDVPHAALFPQVRAVVHHGGAGTTHAGLRAGRPTVICPFFGDQPFWGRLVHARGLGPAPIAQRRLTAPRLASALRELLDSPAMTARAEALGEQLRREDGAAAAVQALEAWAH